MKLSIGEVARLFNISKDTLRYYDKIGILKPEINKEKECKKEYCKDKEDKEDKDDCKEHLKEEYKEKK
ncbi:MerR family DNA-binding transcriptional regulator, partial [Clostridium perfringens]|uniref:MerR family DNA-binding transcriptional regulator n=1 Tax=Clostridium perfringens TaxID=1502 RepID=UPI00375411DC